MDNTIDLILQPITGYLSSIIRNTINGWYEIEVGIPINWVYDENDEIKCDVLGVTETGRLLKIIPKNNTIVIDDLIKFVEIIIETNRKISNKEKEFTDKMEEMKGVLEKEAKKFYKELDELKENSFKNINNDFVKKLHEDKKESRNKKIKEKITLTSDTSLIEIDTTVSQ